MLRAQDRSYTRLDTWLLLGCLALSGIAYFTPERLALPFTGAVRGTALTPLIWLQARAEEGRTSRARFRAVTAQRDSAAAAAQVLPALRAENGRLRQLLSLSRRLSTPYVAAEVMHQAVATDGRVLLLDVGRRDGVEPFDPIVTPEGLIGVVTSVSALTSVGMTWANPEFRVSAFTADGGASGVVAPSANPSASETVLELRGVPYRDSVANGTPVLSSGLGGVYPRGIPLGTVIGVASEQRGWERVYRLRPAATPSGAAHVLVLTAPRAGGVEAAFPNDSVLRALAADSARRQAVADSALRARLVDSLLVALRRDSVARAQRAVQGATEGGTTTVTTPSAANPAPPAATPPVTRPPVPKPAPKAVAQPGAGTPTPAAGVPADTTR